MLSLLARFGSPQAIGVQFEGTVAHACRVASTPFGNVEIARASESFDDGQPQAAVERLVKGLLNGRETLPVSIGIPSDRLFFTTRSMQAGTGDVSPRVLLREALQSTSIPVEEMVVDVLRSQSGRRRVASIVSCQHTLIDEIVEPLEELGLPFLRVEPAPCALLRRGISVDANNRRAKTVCRVFLNDTHLLVVLTANNRALLWRHMKMPRGNETTTILATVRSLSAMGDQSGLEAKPDLVVIHGRSDLHRLLDMDWVHEQIEGELVWLDGPALDGFEVARGLADGCLDEDEGAFNLAQNCQVQRTLWQAFPWGDVAVHAALLIALTMFLSYRLLLVKDEHTGATMRNAQSEIASLSIADLQKEKKDLKMRVSAVKSFLDGRVLWVNYHREIAESLPQNIFLTSARGTNEFATKSKSKSKPKRQLVLKGAVEIPQDGLIPHEVDRLLNTLREHPLLASQFPMIELAELKQFKRPDDDQTLAMFTIMCLPKGVKK